MSGEISAAAQLADGLLGILYYTALALGCLVLAVMAATMALTVIWHARRPPEDSAEMLARWQREDAEAARRTRQEIDELERLYAEGDDRG